MIELAGHPVSKGDHCAFLVEGRCTVYEARPFICRLYAADETFECPHGCEVEGKRLTVAEANALLSKIEALDGALRPVEEDSLDEYFERMRAIGKNPPPDENQES